MPNLYPNLEIAEVDSSSVTDHISVSEGLKLVTTFKGDKREVLTFTANVDMSFEVIDPRSANALLKFIQTRIIGELQIASTHRNLVCWEGLKEFLKNTYIEKNMLDCHATRNVSE
jgi:hypothetical protein